MYRLHVYDRQSTGMHWQIGKGGGFHYQIAESRGQALPVTVFLGDTRVATTVRLANGNRAIGTRVSKEVAERVGFSEPSAFHRAFKRWTGDTPGEYRRRLRS